MGKYAVTFAFPYIEGASV
ncbi:hypothetical protein ECPA10_0358, partial [Escherichia coli PA10]